MLAKSPAISGNNLVPEDAADNDDSDTCEDSDLDEVDLLRDIENPGIYIKRIVKSETAKTGRAKKK
ncbi:hypothetical protein DPMN_189385 [Dreissena polymorpha]|uniref:Uncharacterized protein n=1 Tax=Dreissena polymorpha TaxID=45954 RepID=A0A9D4IAZ1_DREPO|nr:hypothetical protein DPMN_189385 [Dreissena polymorpha]